MFINKIDDLFDEILNQFFNYLIKNNIYDLISKDTNFVKFQNIILNTIKIFIETIPKKKLKDIINNETYINNILDIIKKYCAFYIYLGIAFNYKGGRDLFITNIIESSKNQKDNIFQIPDFFNSNNNSKLFTFYNDIQNIKALVEFKTMEKIEIILSNNPLKFESTIKLFNELGKDYIINYFLVKDNFYNILKTLIFKQLYLKEEKYIINDLLNTIEKNNAEYKYIDIIVSNKNKIVDLHVIQKFLISINNKYITAEDIYSYLKENNDNIDIITKDRDDFIKYLMNEKIIIPMTEEFLRFHKDNEKYDIEKTKDVKNRDATKIKYVISKMNKIKNYYSPLLDNNPKMKLEIESLFYKQLDPRQGVLYNDNEEIKIIQKLMFSDNLSDYDLLIDLENIRKYAYNNYKNVSKDFIKLRTPNTIESIRYVNLKQKQNQLIETRIGNDNIDLNVIGIVWNPTRFNLNHDNIITKPLDCYTCKNLINVNKITKNENGYNSFVKVLNKTILSKKKDNNLYYWLFDVKKDIPKLDTYNDLSLIDANKNISIMLAEIYNIFINFVKIKFENYIDNIDEINIRDLNNMLDNYQKKYIDFHINIDIKNYLINKALTEKLIEIKVIEDEVDNIIPGKKSKIIKLPTVKIEKIKKNIIIINKKNNIEYIEDNNKNIPICIHNIKYINIIKSTNNENYNQNIFNFIKTYVKENNNGEYICKSCNEIIAIKKFIVSGSFNKETNTFITTSLINNQKFEELPKYNIYMRTIRNIEKNLEKIAFNSNLNKYVGNIPSVKIQRKSIVKEVIDLVLIHTEYLKKQPKDRKELYQEKYNINKDLSNLFFFELKDDIFLTSSTDTDKYKILKYNNIITYLIFIIITELNTGNIIDFKDYNKCNYFFYSKFGEQIFSNLFLRLNEKEKTPLIKLPLLAYSIFYFSCLLTNNKLWLWNDTSDKKNDNYNITVQKIIINSTVDLMNSIIEANLEKDKNYLYEIIATRFINKTQNIFNDVLLENRIKIKANKKINYDEKTNKISIIKKNINLIKIDNNNEYGFKLDKKYCNVSTYFINKNNYKKENNTLNNLTNCENGNFHVWNYIKDELVCSLCNEKYKDLIKNTETDIDYVDKLKLINTKKLTEKYCLTGNLHEFNDEHVCILCNINPLKHNYTEKELVLLNNNIYKIKYNNFKNKEIKENNFNYENIYNKLKKNYKRETDYNLENYINKFINRLQNTLGNKIKIDNKTIFLGETFYIINHDYMGNIIKENIVINNDKLKINNNNFFEKDVYYYVDNSNKAYVYYDIVSLQYLGYSLDNKNIKTNKNNVSLIKDLSIKDMLLSLGLENQYINLFHVNSNYIYNMENIDHNEIINNIIRNRIINLKQIISNSNSIINNVKNNNKNKQFYNIEEKKIINEFNKKLKNFNTTNKEGHDSVFKNFSHIKNIFNITQITDEIKIKFINNYFDCFFINNLNNTDCYLLFYIIFNFNRLLDYNNNSELCYLIIKIIEYSFYSYYRDNNHLDIRKFDYLITNDFETANLQHPYKENGYYVDLITEELDEKTKEINNEIEYSANEALNSLDIDDYEVNDDYDETAGVFHND
jgi:hypothetical protein